MHNIAAKKYCKEWVGGWVVSGLRKSTTEEMDKYHTDWPLTEHPPLADEAYLKYCDYADARQAAYRKHRAVNLNLSRDFATEEEARQWMIECAQNGATMLTLLDPETYEWALDAMDDENKFKPMGMHVVADHIQWLMGEDA